MLLTDTSTPDLEAFHERARDRYDAFVRARPEARPDPRQARHGAARPVRPAPRAAGTGRPPGRRRHRRPQLRPPAGPPRAACDPGPGLRRHAGSDRPRRQHEPGADARRGRLRAAHGHVRQPLPLVARRPRGLPLPGSGLRPALRHLRGVRHRDDSRAPHRRGAGHGSGRAPRGGGSWRPRHVVHAEVQQPDGHHLQRGDDRTAGGHADGRGGLPAVVGQRLCRPPPDGRTHRDPQASSRPAPGTAMPTARSCSARRRR
jgi:hypothetical protein